MLAAIGIVKGQPFYAGCPRTADSRSRREDRLQDEPGHWFRKRASTAVRCGFIPTANGLIRSTTSRQKTRAIRAISRSRTSRAPYRDLDARTWFFTNYYSISPGMVSKIPGKGAAYMIGFADSEGRPLSGGSNYKLSLPANIPVANFWSVTLYEAENASGLANGQPFPSLGSRVKPAQNVDGSTATTSDPRLRRAKRPTGLRAFPGEAFSRSCASMARPRLPSTRPGRRATSKRSNEPTPVPARVSRRNLQRSTDMVG